MLCARKLISWRENKPEAEFPDKLPGLFDSWLEQDLWQLLYHPDYGDGYRAKL